MRIINDTHLGATRRGGTTQNSQQALRTHLQSEFAKLLPTTGHLTILGDLFDGFSIDPRDMIAAFNTLSAWLNGAGRSLTLVCGNHDCSPRGDRVSSFHMLAHFLMSMHSNVKMIDYESGFSKVEDGVWAIPHMPNQDLFDMEVARALKGDGGVLLLHCNVVNKFAETSDQSLNLSDEKIDALIAAGWKIVSGHEHQHSTRRASRLVVIGNQIASSVADCLGNNQKFYAEVEGGNVTLVPCCEIGDIFAEVDWFEGELPERHFIRVTGNATAEQAAEVVSKIAAWRSASPAFVITNAVKIEGMVEFDLLSSVSFEDVSKVDVLALLLEELNEAEGKVVKELLND